MLPQFSGYTRDPLIQQAKTLHSRVHALKTLPGWIKREDELSFGISGPKLRKLLPLIHSLKQEGIKGAILCGSCHSNFLLGAVQLLIENGIDYHLVLNKPHRGKIVGNYRYLKRLMQEDKISYEMPKHLPSYRIIKEGGEEAECLEGAKTLAESIYRNEQEIGKPFSKILIDAGVGLSAIGLILGLSTDPRPVHVFSMKIKEEEFFHKLGKNIPSVFFHSLTKHKSFGSVTPSLLHFIDDIAKKEGFFLDPLYGAKMFYELTHFKKELLDEDSLLIHSGGALSLSGFE